MRQLHHHHHHPLRPFLLQSLPANFPPDPTSLPRFRPIAPPFRIETSISTSSLPPPPPPHLRPRRIVTSPSRCSSSSSGGDAAGSDQPLLSGLVGEQVEALLRREENRALLDGLDEASRRVDAARRALADIERQEADAARAREYVLQLESRQSEIAETQRELMEARALVEEAERSLSSSIDGNTSADDLTTSAIEELNKDAERIESIKAATISSVIGTLAGLPISFNQATSSGQLVLHLAVIFVSCALFGVTFRYTMRRDLDNIQLKTGACAAFAFVKGLSATEARKPLEFDGAVLMPLVIDGAVSVSESFFIFIFSAIALDLCFKTRLLSPFPIKK